jgi:hypothetical protein
LNNKNKDKTLIPSNSSSIVKAPMSVSGIIKYANRLKDIRLMMPTIEDYSRNKKILNFVEKGIFTEIAELIDCIME